MNFWNLLLKLQLLFVSNIYYEHATGVLITPWWPAKSWCTRFQSISTPRTFDAPKLYLPSFGSSKNSRSALENRNLGNLWKETHKLPLEAALQQSVLEVTGEGSEGGGGTIATLIPRACQDNTERQN